VKRKIIIAIALALVTLLTFAAPVLAKPVTGIMTNWGLATGTAKCSVSATHLDNLKVTIAVKGGKEVQGGYYVYLYPNGQSSIHLGTLYINSRGMGRFSATTDRTFTNTDSPFTIEAVGIQESYSIENIEVSF